MGLNFRIISVQPITQLPSHSYSSTLSSPFPFPPAPAAPYPKMAPPLDDITRLLADLAGRLSGPPAGGGAASARDSLSASISSLAASLDPDGGASSGTSVLDAALSLMCFDPLEARRPPRLVVSPARSLPLLAF